MAPLPKFVAIRRASDKNMYFRPSGPNEEVKQEALNLISDKNVMHQVVPSTSHTGLIHLKCVGTGKYWSWGKSPASSAYISAQQKNKVENKDDDHCTLINCSYETNNGVTVFHLQLLVHKKWHYIQRSSLGFLMSGQKRGREYTRTNFIIQDWDDAVKAINNKNNNTGAGTSTGKTSTGGGTSTGSTSTGAGASTGNPSTGPGASTTNPNNGGGPIANGGGGGAALAFANMTINGNVSFGKN